MESIRIGVSEKGGTFFSQGMALKSVLKGVSGLPKIEIVESPVGASIENALRLEQGEIDFGFVSAPWVAAACMGKQPFTSAIDLKTVAPMNLGPNFFVTSARTGLHSVSDLKGKKVAVGLRSGGMVPHAEAVFAAIGFKPDDIERVYVGFSEGAEMLARGQVDAQWQCPFPNDVMTRLTELTEIRVLVYSDQQLDSALKEIPYDQPTWIEKEQLRGVQTSSRQLGVLNLLVTHARTEPALVEALCSAIISSAEFLGEKIGLFSGLPNLIRKVQTGSMPLEFDNVRLHPGAVTALRS